MSIHRQLQNLVAVGLTPIRALVVATSAPAADFGLDDRVRSSEPDSTRTVIRRQNQVDIDTVLFPRAFPPS